MPAHLSPDADGPVKDFLLRWRPGLDPRKNLGVDLLEHARHAADEVRPHFFQILAHLVEILGEGRAQPTVYADVRLQPRERMRQRQEEEMDPTFLHRRAALTGFL